MMNDMPFSHAVVIRTMGVLVQAEITRSRDREVMKEDLVSSCSRATPETVCGAARVMKLNPASINFERVRAADV
jgi:hypothetical protein